MSEEKKTPDDKNEDEKVEFTKELDEEAFDVIKRLYDKTFKDLVDR